MSVRFDTDVRSAIELAKRTLQDGEPLDVETLLAALIHATPLRERLPELARVVKPPWLRRQGKKVRTSPALKEVLAQFRGREEAVTANALFAALAASEPGKHFLSGLAIDVAAVVNSLDREGPQPAHGRRRSGWRASPERKRALEALAGYGRVLTTHQLRRRPLADVERFLQSLVVNLCRMKNRNTLIVGPPGTGKTALVYELARRIVAEDPSIPATVRDIDIFELSPAFLRAGASVVGQYEERLKEVLNLLTAHPQIVLFVDEIHSFLQSGMHHRTPFSDANETLKGPLARNEITVIGCTTLAEFRHYIAPDKALADRFSLVVLEPPDRVATLHMLQAQRPAMEAHYRPLRIPDAILRRVVELTDEFLPGRYQPRKSLQLLDEACALCSLRDPPPQELPEDAVVEALETKVGRGLLRSRRLTVDEVYRALTRKIVGQDDVLRRLAEAVVAGMGRWSGTSAPRGVFLFAGPTGVGKTETALCLAELLHPGKDALIRVDCNTLQGSGFDSSPAINRLLGVPPGYVGYTAGQGGILSRVRDIPECVILFDEFEKADPGVSDILLQIVDTGQVEDSDGNLLDFRRSFIIFTTNAGCSYETSSKLGFFPGDQAGELPSVELQSLMDELSARGVGPEFIGRIDHICLFRPLEPETIREVIGRQLERLRQDAAQKGLDLAWDPALTQHLADQWRPRFGVRALHQILRNRVRTQLGIAEAQGELEGVTRIFLVGPSRNGHASEPADRRYRQGDTLVIALA